jgi:hypothetical protein
MILGKKRAIFSVKKISVGLGKEGKKKKKSDFFQREREKNKENNTDCSSL